MRIGMGGYRALARAAVPLAALYLLRRSGKQPAYRNFWGERFGTAEYPPPAGCPRIWVHAVSVGETAAARPLVDAILEARPDVDILLTHMTPTGRDAGRRIVESAPGRVLQCYLPYDLPGAMEKFFRQTKPSMGIVMETEIWPTMMAEAERWGVPMVLANARESERSMRKALKVPRLMIPAVRRFTAILAQSEGDAARFRTLGSERVTVVGSLKFDIRPDAAQVARAREWKAALGRPVELVASTREGEEVLLLEELAKGRRPGNALVLLVPRHPQRFGSVLNLVRNAGIRVQRRSELSSASGVSPDTEVLLGDSMGEMSFYCGLADTALMGGSFLEYGCQNLIEPCASGVPVILGPSVFNFAEVSRNALDCGAARQAKDFEGALALSSGLLSDRAALAGASRKASLFAAEYTGATARTMKILDSLWKKKPSLQFPMS